MNEMTIVDDRLDESRARLRQAMMASTKPASSTSGPASGATAAWLDGVKSSPGVSILLEAASSWWMRHPLRLATRVGADAANAVIQPMAQRNPLGLVLGAALLGAVVAWTRPWRWLLKPALLAGFLPQVISKVITQAPSTSWVTVLMSLADARRQKTAK